MLTVNLLRRIQSKSVLKLEPLSTCLPSAILAVTLVVGLSQVILATGLSAQEAPPTPNDQKSVDALETEMEELREELARLSLTNLNDEANDLVSDVNSTDELQEDMQELQRQLALLAAEVERLRSGEQEEALTADQARALGVAPSAASIYEREDSGVSIAGYGEMLYENYADKTETGTTSAKGTKLDFLRHIFYMGYRFNDKFLFNSEVEIEHADEIYLEFAYVDYQVRDNLTLRGGMLLIPLGLVNEFHEPNVFMGARRPQIERRIIPTTWRENGVGILGNRPIRQVLLPSVCHERIQWSEIQHLRPPRWATEGSQNNGQRHGIFWPARFCTNTRSVFWCRTLSRRFRSRTIYGRWKHSGRSHDDCRGARSSASSRIRPPSHGRSCKPGQCCGPQQSSGEEFFCRRRREDARWIPPGWVRPAVTDELHCRPDPVLPV